MRIRSITILIMSLFVPNVLLAGALENARDYAQTYLQLAVKIKASPTSEEGTGFFTELAQDSTKLVLTTAKHVLENADELCLTILLSDSADTAIDSVTLCKALFKNKPNVYCELPGFDLAFLIVHRDSLINAILARRLDGRKLSFLSYHHYADTRNLFAGQPVLFPGYPLGLRGNRGTPLLTRGSIAGIDEANSVIYLAALAAGGSSGSPVFIDFTAQANVDFFSKYSQILVGMITGYWAEKKPYLQSEGDTTVLTAGIVNIVPAETIRSIMDSCFVRGNE